MDRWAYDMKMYKPDEVRTVYKRDLLWASQNGWELVSLVPIANTVIGAGMTSDLVATFKKKMPQEADAAPRVPPPQYALRP